MILVLKIILKPVQGLTTFEGPSVSEMLKCRVVNVNGFICKHMQKSKQSLSLKLHETRQVLYRK